MSINELALNDPVQGVHIYPTHLETDPIELMSFLMENNRTIRDIMLDHSISSLDELSTFVGISAESIRDYATELERNLFLRTFNGNDADIPSYTRGPVANTDDAILNPAGFDKNYTRTLGNLTISCFGDYFVLNPGRETVSSGTPLTLNDGLSYVIRLKGIDPESLMAHEELARSLEVGYEDIINYHYALNHKSDELPHDVVRSSVDEVNAAVVHQLRNKRTLGVSSDQFNNYLRAQAYFTSHQIEGKVPGSVTLPVDLQEDYLTVALAIETAIEK